MNALLQNHEVEDLAHRFAACGGRSFGIEFRQFIERPDHFEQLFRKPELAAWSRDAAHINSQRNEQWQQQQRSA